MISPEISPNDYPSPYLRPGEKHLLGLRRQFRLYHAFVAIAVIGLVLALGTQGFPEEAAWLSLVSIAAGLYWLFRTVMAPVLFVGVIFLSGLLLPTCYIPPSQAKKAHCASNLRQLAIAINAYETRHGSLPPAYLTNSKGQPWVSWRVLLLPELGEQALYDRYHLDEPWNSPNNLAIAKDIPAAYRCPATLKGKDGITQYVAIVSPETMWPGATGRLRAEVTDGSSDTILLIEWSESDIVWTEPRDVPLGKLLQVLHPTGKTVSDDHRHPDGVNVVLGWATTQFLRQDTSVRDLRAMATAAGNDTWER